MAQTSMTSFFGAGTNKDGSKKRGRNDDEASTASKKKLKAATNKIVLITAPGAGGKSSKHALQLFQELSTRCGMTVCRMDQQEPVAWNKFTPSNKKNMTAVLTAVKRISKSNPDKRLLLCGHSFGCRVIAEAMRLHGDELRSHNVLDAFVCQGYPLLKSGVPETDSNNVKRAAHLQQLPPSTQVLVIQGERDNFLGPRGMQSLRDLVENLNDDSQDHIRIVEIPKCGHDLTAKDIPQVRESIVDFATGLVEDDEE